MDIPVTAVYMAILGFLTLFSISGFLIVYSSRRLKIQRDLEQDIKRLNIHIKKLKVSVKKAAKQTMPPLDVYKLAVNQQLDHTRNYHKSLNSDNDISLDINVKSPTNCQTAAVRNMFLVAERESAATSADGTPNWQILEDRIQQLVQFYRHEFAGTTNTQNQETTSAADSSATTEQIEELQNDVTDKAKKLAELEHLGELLNEFEDRWIDTRHEVAQYYNELIKLTNQLDNATSIELLLNSYNDAYAALEPILVRSGSGKIEAGVVSTAAERENRLVSPLSRSLQEINHLKEVSQKQQETVEQLKDKLKSAQSIEAKAELADELNNQLDSLQQAASQSESCIKMLTEQLEESKQESINLSNQLEKMKKNLAQIPQLEKLVKEFSEESKVMLREIAELEREGKVLQDKIEHPEVSVEDLQELQQKLTELHVQHTELEERYCALKEKTEEQNEDPKEES